MSLLLLVALTHPADTWKAGVARTVITPAEPLWLAGYAGRTKPADGKLHDLFAKALALEDAQGQRLVLVTTDLLGLSRTLTETVAAAVTARTGLPRERLLLTASHTHSGPVLSEQLADMYPLPPDQPAKLTAYTKKLEGQLIDLVAAALADLKPAKLHVGQGSAGFVINRRQGTDKGVILGTNPAGPTDRSVPVLRVTAADGTLRAVSFGYACHNTTLDLLQWSGDYAGFAQAAVEAKHPGATALFWSGCGGDANPHPRRTIELAQKHGKELAHAVEAVLTGIAGDLTPLTGPTRAKYTTIDLPLEPAKPREQWAADALSKSHAVKQRADRMLKLLVEGKPLPTSYPHYPVQAWTLGDKLTWVALGGEVTVEYALRLKRELPGPHVWVTAYANDVMAYIPSEIILREGGYEGDSSMLYYGLPGKWKPGLEAKIVNAALGLVK